uniref:Uncharacterized protein n=1 Tax=Scleropages formosus TaxID=113540 RepID=A0A8C9W8L0_SCLFO
MWVYLSLSINTNNYGAYWYLSNNISTGLCSQLGCGNIVSLSYNTISTNVLQAQCTGRESAVTECNLYFQSGSSWYSTLTCSGNVRLVNGSNECGGRVELLYSSQWVSLYDTGWTTQQSNLVCSQLGCGPAVATGSGETPGSALQALCSGAESALQSCSFQSCSSCAANNSRSVTVVCSGGVRLVNGSHNCTGDVQIFLDGTWMYFYFLISYYKNAPYWYLSNSITAGLCSQLGCGNTVSLSSNTIGSTSVLQARCTGRETAIRECNLYFQSGGTRISTLACSGNVRLVNGSNECGGRVELLYSSQWVSLYDTGWTTQQSNVVCSQLGCGQAVATGSGETPGSALQALCSGAESALQSCSFQSCSSCAANKSTSVTVVCSGGVRLVNGQHNCTGNAQIFLDGTWMYLYLSFSYYYIYWYSSNSVSARLCSQLGCGNFLSLSYNTIGSTNILEARCTGGESDIRECILYFQRGGTSISTLTCSGSTISATTQPQTTETTAFVKDLEALLNNSNGQVTKVLNDLLSYLWNSTNLSEGKAETFLNFAFGNFYNRSDNVTDNIESANILLEISETIASLLIEPNATYSNKTLKTQYLEIRVTVGSNTSQILPLVANGNEMKMNSSITQNNGSVSATLISYVEMENIMTARYFKKDNGAKMFSSVTEAFLKQIPAMEPINLTEPIIFLLKHNQMKPQDGNVICVYWNDTGMEKFWSELGCTATYTDENYTECSCTHLSIFALILQVDDNETNNDLTMMSKIFEITGLVFFALAIITFALTSQTSKVNNTSRLNLCISLFLAHLLFLTGSDRTENQVICSVIAGSLHFLFLASFAWMFLEAVQLVLLMRNLRKVEVLRKQGLPYGYLLVFGYLFPAIIVAITAGLFPEGYGDQNQCWLKKDKNLRWSFLGPVILILCANYISFLMIIWHLYFVLGLIQQDLSTIKDVRILVLKNCVQFAILGCSWVLGFFPEVKIFAVLFIVINSQQGTFIFLVYCLFNTQVREQYKKWFGCFFHKKITERTDTQTQSLS